jgi:general secretion pathway protein M
MTLNNLSTKQQSQLALGLLLLCLLILVFGLIMPLVTDYTENDTKIASLQAQLQRYQAKAVTRESVIAQTAELKNTILHSEIFYNQKSLPLVAADMQERIKNSIDSAGGELNSTQNIAQKTVDGLIKLGISASFSGKMDTVKNCLYAIESAKPYLIIDKIKIYGSGNEKNSTTGKIDAANTVYIFADISTYVPQVTP